MNDNYTFSLIDQRKGNKEVYITSSDFFLGRTEQNDLPLSDPKSSSRHAYIQHDGDSAYITDLKSANGTYVNKKVISSKTALLNGDFVQIGDQKFIYKKEKKKALSEASTPTKKEPLLTLVSMGITDCGKEVHVENNEFFIGRSSSNNLKLSSHQVSSRHIRISIENDEAYLFDLKSSNGTKVNGSNVTQRTLLANGDLIQMGDFSYVVKKNSIATVKATTPQIATSTTVHITDTERTTKSLNTKTQIATKLKLSKTQSIRKSYKVKNVPFSEKLKVLRNAPSMHANWKSSSVSLIFHIVLILVLIFVINWATKKAPTPEMDITLAPQQEKDERVAEEILPEIEIEIKDDQASTMHSIDIEEEQVLPSQQTWESSISDAEAFNVKGGASASTGNGLIGDDEIGRRLKKNKGRQKDLDIRATLIWHDNCDLDLIIKNPLKESVNFYTKIDTFGGLHDLDSNAKAPFSNSPIENVVWPKSYAPEGKYIAKVFLYKKNGVKKKKIPFILELQVKHKITHYKGSISLVGETKRICNFTFDPDSVHYAADKEQVDVTFE